MKRLSRPRKLPPLTVQLHAGHTRAYAVLKTLRGLALRLRGATAQPFYSTREVARHFGVPQPTVVQVYRELEAEGLLVRLRSTGTLLQPRKRQPRNPVRGVVGVPIWLWGFTENLNWRTFLISLETHLRRHHFVANFVFFGFENICHSDFFDRLVAHQLDYLVWFSPLPGYTPMLQTLVDCGIQVAVVCDTDWRPPFPTYQVDWERPLAAGLRAWVRDGVTRVLALHAAPDAYTLGRVTPLLERSGLPFEWHHIKERDLADIAAGIPPQEKWGVIIPSEDMIGRWSGSRPAEMAALAQRTRVMIRAPLKSSPEWWADCRFDLVETNWDQLAARIADDLAVNRWRPDTEPVLFSARWRPQVLATKLLRLV